MTRFPHFAIFVVVVVVVGFVPHARGAIMELTDSDDFERRVLRNPRPVLVALTSEHCMACKLVMGDLKKLASSRPTLDLAMVDVVRSERLADDFTRRFSRRLIPNVLGFRGGVLIGEAEDHGTKSLTRFMDKVEKPNLDFNSAS